MPSKSLRVKAEHRPIARVLPLLGLPHLDRGFDYLVSTDDDHVAQPGVRVRIRFSGRLVDAILLERRESSEFDGQLRFLDRVIAPEVVYPERIERLVDALAQRYAGTRSDLIRLAIPPRHAGAEQADVTTPYEDLGEIGEPDLSAWSAYEHGQSFVDAVVGDSTARAVWQIAPGEDWAAALAALAVKVVKDGAGALLVVPDQKDVDALERAARELVSARQVVTLTAGLRPQARYRRYLSILHGQARLVIGTRSAAFAPVHNLRLSVIVHDGDENLTDPRAPYPHAREILTTRSVIERSTLVIAGYTRTAEAQLLVSSGWAHGLVASRTALRTRMPLIRAAGDSDFELAKDPRARSARIPSMAFEAARRALERDKPVVILTPRKGYIPTLACKSCRAPARCRACNGPLGLPESGEASVPTCRWCGRLEPRFSCSHCGSHSLRAVVLGAHRTAEELGRAFPSVRVIVSGGQKVLAEVADTPALVVATPGAIPSVEGTGSYGAALLLDSWALLGRQDLRAAEDTLATWAYASAQVQPHREGGEVVIVAEPSLAVVQDLIRFDVVGAAERELEQRQQVRFPPAVHMAAIDGAQSSLDALVEHAELPAHAEVLGPVDLPPGVSMPGDYSVQQHGPAQRILIRTPLGPRAELGSALRAAAVSRSLVKDSAPVRITVDPIRVG
ncbi:primosomal protein N' [Corynebacterium tapiri]|uniref:Probable replication restart protein PriA n=1 Tax=Corynebacterium tapiri TaxID=1448266 RepID=A0A5C4U3S4_9CORY|nr:primosomal protein N' [Corynebacterium tapiri]TNL97792.1 primosomal protein N' [Corynebacterium tapiri]